MPPTTSVRTFIRALQTGRTRITEALDDLLTRPGLATNAHFAAFSVPGALNGPLPSYLRDAMIERGLTDAEMSHMEHWPDAQKEAVRAALVMAITISRPVKFEWVLQRGGQSENEIDSSGAGPITVIFRSPRAKVKITTTGTTESHDISVDI